MNSQTMATVIENVADVGTSLLKDHFVRRQERAQMENEMEMRKEIAQARSNAMGGTDTAQDASAAGAGALNAGQEDDPLHAAETVAEQYSDLLDNAIRSEGCGMCRMLIEAITEKPIDVQKRAIPELRVLKQKAEGGAGSDELKEYIRSTDVLKEVMKEETAKRATQAENTETLTSNTEGSERTQPSGGSGDRQQSLDALRP